MPNISPQQADLLTLCALRIEKTSIDWHLIARICQSPDGLAAMLTGEIPEESAAARKNLPILKAALRHIDEARDRAQSEVDAAATAGARLVTVLDRDYPANLRLVPNLPPFLFYCGDLLERDARSAAVVGTRNASEDGMRRAARMTRGLVEQNVAIFSGLAKGIDTAAHTATLDVGGRTVAVMGTGIAAKIYPAENRPLARRILNEGGALLSQFWPTSPPATWTFPRRNVVTSGATLGSIVIEASSTSGAKMQARIAAEHGKHVFLLKSLATREEWAAKMIADGRAVEVVELEDVLSRLGTAKRIQRAADQRLQLALADL
ncbi:DNA-processing protein DprA [Actinacidiphila sp. ITFR-21]|uniref:DNA-processing protein DprA n=1 Tax=Actinacidiphila sp. ITFR-21 TaxID=3075199 RepID=UPI00288ACC8B|nr:DNA-processing protein DprA [Streptomyces sp. ITFR-21]WNI19218.1 DNA-processing protein DprA [Streptomyces sp. ITFR-21]